LGCTIWGMTKGDEDRERRGVGQKVEKNVRVETGNAHLTEVNKGGGKATGEVFEAWKRMKKKNRGSFAVHLVKGGPLRRERAAKAKKVDKNKFKQCKQDVRKERALIH